MDEELVNVLVKVKKHQVMMLQDRKYELPPSEAEWLNYTPKQASERLRSIKNRNEEGESVVGWSEELGAEYMLPSRLWVYYFPKKTVGKDDAADMVEQLETLQRPRHMLLVGYKRPTKDAWAILNEYDVEFWTYAQLAVNVTKHFLSQRHTPLTPEQKREFLAVSKIDPQCLPLLYFSDPMARWYKFKVGQIIKVDRLNIASFASSSTVFYRLVVPEPLSDHATKPTMTLP
jgi:DNA-directed RNA polymerase subunit H (RpoH/RPB5)